MPAYHIGWVSALSAIPKVEVHHISCPPATRACVWVPVCGFLSLTVVRNAKLVMEVFGWESCGPVIRPIPNLASEQAAILMISEWLRPMGFRNS
jgi:hypothetical protein